MLNDVNIDKVNGYGREAENEDRVSLLLCGGVSVEYGDNQTTGLNTLHGPFYSAEDAEAVGITAQLDTDMKVLIHHHIVQHFRPYGERISTRPAKPLYLYMVSQSTPLSVMLDKDEDYSAYKALHEAELKCRHVMVVLNPQDGYTPDIADNGFDADVALAVAKAQQTADALYDEHGPVEFYIECRDFNPAIAGDALNLATLAAENVSLVIFQDLDVCDIDPLHEGYAAVGTYLGLATSKPTLANSPAEVGLNYEGNIQDKAEGYFLRYGYGNRKLTDWNITAQGVLYDKRYVALRVFANTSGVYVTQSHTCAPATSDYIYSELNAIHNKAHRGLYGKYVPYVNAKVRLTEQGYLPGDVVKVLEERGDSFLRGMVNRTEISAGKTYIDPLQRDDNGQPTNLAVTRRIKVRWKMVQEGKLENIDGELSFAISLE